MLGASAVLLVLAAMNHARLAAAGAGAVARHWAFVGIDLVAALLVARAPRWRWALYPMLLLAAQQMWSHGGDLVRDHDDWASAGVLVFFPLVLTSLVVERRRRT